MSTRNDPTAGGLSHDEAMALQRDELNRTVELLATLTPAEWTARTDCPDWDVHHLYLHVLGACEAAASMREMAHQMRAARTHQKRNGGALEAALSATQVREREQLDPQQLVERLRAVAPTTVAKRSSMPTLLRNGVRMKVDGPVFERWRLGYLLDTIYLRDLWLHRIDACIATGRPAQLDAAHDGRIVADVVAEWGRRHGRPFTLVLGGPAGGEFSSDTGGEHLELDAVEFCRALSGRQAAEGLLSTVVPF